MKEILQQFAMIVVVLWIWFLALFLGAMPFVAAGYAIYMWWR